MNCENGPNSSEQFTKTVVSSDDAPSFSLNNYLLHLAWFLLSVGAQHWLKNAVNIYFCIDESLSWHYK